MEELNSKQTRKKKSPETKANNPGSELDQIKGEMFLHFSSNWERNGEMKIRVFS